MKQAPSTDKLRGGYYTPAAIARFLCEWAITADTANVLEPSCGDGRIVTEAIARIGRDRLSASVLGVELSASEASKARANARAVNEAVPCSIVSSSFFREAQRAMKAGVRYDAVVGNPPFVRYQDFPEDERQAAFSLMRSLGLNPSRLANAWLPFVALSAGLLSERGRLAMVVPAELFQVGYASELRQFLADSFPQIHLVTFKKLVFPDIQQEVVLLLADRAATARKGIRVIEVSDADCLADMDVSVLARKAVKPMDHAAEKWTKYFLSRAEILLLRELRERADIPQLSRFVDVDVGVVTGNNDYFLLSREEVDARKLHATTVPLVGRSAALAGTRFSTDDFTAWVELGRKAYMFLPAAPLCRATRAYIAHGKNLGVDKGYKCGIRREWFVVPSVWKPDVFFLRQADGSPRMVANETNAICTDTLHRGRLLDGQTATSLATAFNNSLTFAASEVTGRSYGGGVMTFEPSEMERLPLPIAGIDEIDPIEIDRLIRSKRVEDALDIVDRTMLQEGLGFSSRDVRMLRGIWMKLRDRRRGRKQRASN